jgi:hypothetical protein
LGPGHRGRDEVLNTRQGLAGATRSRIHPCDLWIFVKAPRKFF